MFDDPTLGDSTSFLRWLDKYNGAADQWSTAAETHRSKTSKVSARVTHLVEELSGLNQMVGGTGYMLRDLAGNFGNITATIVKNLSSITSATLRDFNLPPRKKVVEIGNQNWRELRYTLLVETQKTRKLLQIVNRARGTIEYRTNSWYDFGMDSSRRSFLIVDEVQRILDDQLSADQAPPNETIVDYLAKLPSCHWVEEAAHHDAKRFHVMLYAARTRSALADIEATLQTTLEDLDSLSSLLESVHAAVRDEQAAKRDEQARKEASARADSATSRERHREEAEQAQRQNEDQRRVFELTLATVAVVLITPSLVASVYGASILSLRNATILGMVLQMATVAILSVLLVGLYGGITHIRRRGAPPGVTKIPVSVLRLPLPVGVVAGGCILSLSLIVVIWINFDAAALHPWERIVITVFTLLIGATFVLLGPPLIGTRGFSSWPTRFWSNAGRCVSLPPQWAIHPAAVPDDNGSTTAESGSADIESSDREADAAVGESP